MLWGDVEEGQRLRWIDNGEIHTITSVRKGGRLTNITTKCDGVSVQRCFMTAATMQERYWCLVTREQEVKRSRVIVKRKRHILKRRMG